jgi:hypothetical protein
MPWKPAAPSDLQRQVDVLSLKVLKLNAELRMKSVYCQRLEHLLHERNETDPHRHAKAAEPKPGAGGRAPRGADRRT